MLNNYSFLLQPSQNETQLQSSFFFLFFKTQVIVCLAFLRGKNRKGDSSMAVFITVWLLRRIKNKPTLKQRISETFQSLYSLSWILKLLLLYMFHWRFLYVFFVCFVFDLRLCLHVNSHCSFLSKIKNIEIRDLSIIYQQTRNFAKKTSPFWNTLYFVDTFIICSLSIAHI